MSNNPLPSNVEYDNCHFNCSKYTEERTILRNLHIRELICIVLTSILVCIVLVEVLK